MVDFRTQQSWLHALITKARLDALLPKRGWLYITRTRQEHAANLDFKHMHHRDVISSIQSYLVSDQKRAGNEITTN